MGSLSLGGFGEVTGSDAPGRVFGLARLVVILLVAGGIPLGCATTDQVDRTGGVRVTVDVVDSEQMRYERFELLEDGSFKWGGGRDALREKTTWGTQLDEPCARRLISLMRSNGWIPGPPEPADEDGVVGAGNPASNERITVVGRSDGARFRWSEPRAGERIDEVLKAFAEVASRRDASRVDRLARPRTTR